MKKDKLPERELEILQQIRHLNIVEFIEIYHLEEEAIVITELLQGGELVGRLDENGFPEAEAANIIKEVAEALKYLHSMRIVHRDIKLENVMFVSRNRPCSIKLIDFGLAIKLEEGETRMDQVGSPDYCAPEVLQKKPYGTEVDMWSLGVMMYALLSSCLPFDHPNGTKMVEKIVQAQFQFEADEGWGNISEEAKDLISKLLVVDLKQRYTAEMVLKHPWFTSPKSPPGLRNKVSSLKDKMKTLGTEYSQKAKGHMRRLSDSGASLSDSTENSAKPRSQSVSTKPPVDQSPSSFFRRIGSPPTSPSSSRPTSPRPTSPPPRATSPPPRPTSPPLVRPTIMVTPSLTQSLSSTSLESLQEELNKTVMSLANTQTEKWQLEARIEELEHYIHDLHEELANKDKIIRKHSMLLSESLDDLHKPTTHHEKPHKFPSFHFPSRTERDALTKVHTLEGITQELVQKNIQNKTDMDILATEAARLNEENKKLKAYLVSLGVELPADLLTRSPSN